MKFSNGIFLAKNTTRYFETPKAHIISFLEILLKMLNIACNAI